MSLAARRRLSAPLSCRYPEPFYKRRLGCYFCHPLRSGNRRTCQYSLWNDSEGSSDRFSHSSRCETSISPSMWRTRFGRRANESHIRTFGRLSSKCKRTARLGRPSNNLIYSHDYGDQTSYSAGLNLRSRTKSTRYFGR